MSSHEKDVVDDIKFAIYNGFIETLQSACYLQEPSHGWSHFHPV